MNDDIPSTNTFTIFTKSPPAYRNLNSVFHYAHTIFYDITFNIMVSKERGMFYNGTPSFRNLTPYFVSSFCFRTHIFNLPQHLIRLWTIRIVHFTSDFKIMR